MQAGYRRARFRVVSALSIELHFPVFPLVAAPFSCRGAQGYDTKNVTIFYALLTVFESSAQVKCFSAWSGRIREGRVPQFLDALLAAIELAGSPVGVHAPLDLHIFDTPA